MEKFFLSIINYMSLNHILTANANPLDVQVNNLTVDGTLTLANHPLTAVSSGVYTPIVGSADAGVGVVGTVECSYYKIGTLVKVSAHASVTFAGVATPETFKFQVSVPVGMQVSGTNIYGVGTGGAPSDFTTGISPPLVGVYAGSPSSTTLTLEFRQGNNAALANTVLDSDLYCDFTFVDTA
jgi:hypothetical protein